MYVEQVYSVSWSWKNRIRNNIDQNHQKIILKFYERNFFLFRNCMLYCNILFLSNIMIQFISNKVDCLILYFKSWANTPPRKASSLHYHPLRIPNSWCWWTVKHWMIMRVDLLGYRLYVLMYISLYCIVNYSLRNTRHLHTDSSRLNFNQKLAI